MTGENITMSEFTKMEKHTQNIRRVHLLVSAGPNVGARFDLTDDRRYSVGSDVSTDIVVFDEKVLPHHLFLEVKDGVVSVTSGDGVVLVSGTVLKQDVSHVCTAHCAIEFGDTRFYVRSSVPDNINEDVVLGSEVGESSRTILNSENVFSKKTLLGFSALFAMLVSVIVVITYSPSLVAKTKHQLTEEVEFAIKSLALENISVSVLSDGKIKLDGYTDRDHQLSDLFSATEKFGRDLELDVVSDEKILVLTNDLLARFSSSSNVRAVSSFGGNVMFSGIVVDEASWFNVLENIKRDISDINNVDANDVLTLPVLMKLIQAHMFEKLPDVVLEFIIVDSSIVMRGLVEKSARLKINAIANQLTEKYGNRLSLIIQLVTVSSELEEFRVTSIGIGSLSYFVTETGDKYLTGARLSSGHVVLSIEKDRVFLMKSGKKTIHLIGET